MSGGEALPGGAAAAAPGATDAAALATRLRVAITRLSRTLRTNSPGNLTQSQWSALVTVETHQPIRVGDIAEYEGVSAPTATRLVASLEAIGLLDRTTDPTDRRSAYVSLTEEGRGKLDWARGVRTAALSRRLSRLPEGDLRQLADALPLLEKLVTED
jgi:DNA-binding MarR family transcriptional regulator